MQVDSVWLGEEASQDEYPNTVWSQKKKGHLGYSFKPQCVHCHAPNTFGTVNMEHTINSSLSWSKQ